MPVERDARGEVAQKAPYNKFPHICVPVIDVITGWQQEESSLKIDDGEEMGDALTDKAALVCRYGGFIQVVEIYEREGEKDKTELAEAAYQVLNQWLIGGDTAVSEEELIVAINDLALYGEINSIASLNKIDSPLTSMENRINESFKRNSKFDNIILAWTNYWNMTMEQEYGGIFSC